MKCKTRQLEMRFPTRGGKRRGAGRKPKGLKAGVPHTTRPALAARHPVHATLKVLPHVWNLRSRRSFRAIGRALSGGKERDGFRLVHFSVLGNHLHLIVEALDAQRLTRGMQGLAIRIARRLNVLMCRRGDVFADRYYAHQLRSPTEVARAVAYVLGNYLVHAVRRGETVRQGFLDPYSSAVAVELTVRPETWLLNVGWKRACGVIDARA